MLVFAVIFAGLFLVARPLFELVVAARTGVIVGKGHGAPRIERAARDGRFEALMHQRLANLTPGVLMVVGGVAWLIAASTTWG